MIAWWNDLSLIQQIFALIAIPSTLIMLIQTVMLLIGADDGGADGDVETDVDVDSGFALFSVRGVVSTLAVMGWSAVALLETLPELPALLISVVLGALTLVGTAYLMHAVAKLQSSGNINVENAIGKVAEVYIPIPAAGKGTGKVTMTLQEKYGEYTALTTHDEKLTTGQFVRVVSVDGMGILVVEPIAKGEKA